MIAEKESSTHLARSGLHDGNSDDVRVGINEELEYEGEVNNPSDERVRNRSSRFDLVEEASMHSKARDSVAARLVQLREVGS